MRIITDADIRLFAASLVEREYSPATITKYAHDLRLLTDYAPDGIPDKAALVGVSRLPHGAEGDALRFYRAQPVNGQRVGDYVRGWFDEARAVQNIADTTERGGYTLLTEDEIAAWQERLTSMAVVDGMGYASPVSCFLTSHYGSVGDIDLEEFLAYCPLAEEVTDEAEFQALAEKTGLLADKTLDTMPVPVHRYRVSRINELLRQYAGITLDDLRTNWRSDPRTPYLSEYNAFYNFTSDFGPGTFYPAYGYRNGEQITLLEAGYFGDMLILAERPDGGFWFVEHSPSGRVPQGF